MNTCDYFFTERRPGIPKATYPVCGKPATWSIPGKRREYFYCDEHHHSLSTEGDPKGLDAHKWKRLAKPTPAAADGKGEST